MPGPLSERTLILATEAHEAAALVAQLTEAGCPAVNCADPAALVAGLEDGAGLALIADEALGTGDLATLSAWIAAQPPWSDFPLVILTRPPVPGADPARATGATRWSGLLGNAAFLERPFGAATLVSIVRTAARSRRRQYEARALIRNLDDRDDRLRLAQDAGGVGTFVWHPATGLVEVSDQFRRLWGLDGRPVVSLAELGDSVLPADRHLVVAPGTVPDGAALEPVEYRIRRRDTGEIRWIARRGEIHRDGGGLAVRGVGIVYDITEHKAAREAEQASRERFLEAIDASGSRMGTLVREKDWSLTALGPPGAWPTTLRSALGVCLNSRFPVCIYWGPDLVLLYNDPWSAIPGDKHPWVLGRPGREAWADIWPIVGPQFESVLAGGPAVHIEDGLLPMQRHGFVEETYFTYNISPIYGEDGQVAGIFNAGIDTTFRVVSERRAVLLRDLLDGVLREREAAAMCRAAAAAMAADPADIPFALVYLMEEDGRATLAARHGVPAGDRLAPPAIDPDSADAPWPLGRVARSYRAELVSDVGRLAGRPLVIAPWPEPVEAAYVVPIRQTGRANDLAGFLVAGISPRRSFDAVYAGFFGAIAGHLATAVATASGFEEDRRFREALQREVAERTRERDRLWRLSQELLLVADADGAIVSVNPSSSRILGWGEGEMVGRTWFDFLHPDDVEATGRELVRLREGLSVSEHKGRWRTRAGAYRMLDWTAVSAEGFVHAVGRDVTEEHEAAAALAVAEEQLRQAQKMEAVGQLTGGIAHDFNNLLTGIIGSLDLMQTRIGQGRHDALDRYVRAATASANRAAALAHRLLAFARRQPLDPRPVAVDALVASMEELLRRTIGERVVLEIVAAGPFARTLCDANQLESAVLNLAINARDAMPDGGRLVLDVGMLHLDAAYVAQHPDAAIGDHVVLSVTDTGTGMPPPVIARAFDPFFTTKPIGQGTGLGLSMIYGFVRQSGGHATIRSEVARGTTVSLFLPRHGGETEREAVPAPTAEVARAVRHETVLVVEDEAVVRDLVVEVVGELGLRAIQAVDGPAGLAVLRSDRPIDLLVTDVGLPGLDGRQLASKARTARPDLKILFITGYAESAAGEGFLEPGMELITKPFAVDLLARRIREMMGP